MGFLLDQGPVGVAFFEATAFLVLLTLFVLFQQGHRLRFLRTWLYGWSLLTLSALIETGTLIRPGPSWRLIAIGMRLGAVLLFLASALEYSVRRQKRLWQLLPLALVCGLVLGLAESKGRGPLGHVHWGTALVESAILLMAGRMLWQDAERRGGHGERLLGGGLLLAGLHSLDRPLWMEHPLFLLRVAFDHLLLVAAGIGMVVLVLEEARTRADELNDKLRRLTLITTASTQSLNVSDVLREVLAYLVQSLGAMNGMVGLLEGTEDNAELVLRASVGCAQANQEKRAYVSAKESWVQQVLGNEFSLFSVTGDCESGLRQRMLADGITDLIVVRLPGSEGPLGVLSIGSSLRPPFQEEEITFLVNAANLLGLTIQNVQLFERVARVQRQWEYTFDSIGDPLFVHDQAGTIIRANLRFANLLGRDPLAVPGRKVGELLPRPCCAWKDCPYCEGAAGEGDDPDPWLKGYFLASNSTFTDPAGRRLGTVHVLRDISERKRAEKKYQTLVARVQEGVFISTPQGRFVDFNDAFLHMMGFEDRAELLDVDIPSTLYVDPSDRERLKKILQEHGSVSDFEFQVRRKDREIRTVQESSVAVRDTTGNITAIQGFLLDVTERKRAEQEIQRRNRELMVLNSIGRSLIESLDLSDALHRTLRQISELFGLEVGSVYLLDEGKGVLRRVAAVGHRSEYARAFPPAAVQGELLQHVRSAHAMIVAAQGLPLPAAFRDLRQKEGLAAAHVIILWSKDRMIGCMLLGSRTERDLSPAESNLLVAVGTQISSSIERSLLYEEARQALENLRRTQEQLLQSEKMAAIGQLISGVAHELNNPLTAILGYSQLLTSSGQVGPQANEYVDKLQKQAQRTHRIVQNLLSFARQHRQERLPVSVNKVIEDTLALRDYDLKVSNIRIHTDLAPDLPPIAADPHQLQQVFLNIVNNAADAILEDSHEGDIWVRTARDAGRLRIEFRDNGPGIQDTSRVFDPFYTTKPVGKGTGLGLSICYGIVTSHGGSIQVRNSASPGHGAVFTVELPCSSPEAIRALISSELRDSSHKAGEGKLQPGDPATV
jgi:two-component system NtrC family sensor kinase